MSRQVFTVRSNFTIDREGELFLGEVQVRLIKQVLVDGSIHAAAKNLKMSYQHAWHLLDRLNRLSPVPVLVKQKGGKDGGGCLISSYGMKLIRMYEGKASELERFLEQLSSEWKDCFF